MINRIESGEIIDAIDRKYKEPEKLSFLSTEDTFTIYKKHKLARINLDEIYGLLDANIHLINEERSTYDIIAECLLNKLKKKKKPFPDLKAIPKQKLEKMNNH